MGLGFRGFWGLTEGDEAGILGDVAAPVGGGAAAGTSAGFNNWIVAASVKVAGLGEPGLVAELRVL